MFRSWKSQVTDPLGMFEEWGLDRMMRRHRTRMDTMIREGKPPEDDQTERVATTMEEDTPNPYVEEECGGTSPKTSLQSASKEETNIGLNGNSEGEKVQLGLDMPQEKMYQLWLQENLENVKSNTGPQNCDVGIFAYWRECVPKDIGMFIKWRDERRMKTDRKNTDIEGYKEKLKLKREALQARLEAMSSEEAIIALLRGDLNASSKIPKKMLRLFISSTFCDTKAERNFLMRDTYPKIRDICDQNGIAFIAVDLGWGQADASVFDHEFSRLCLQEMSNSRQQSMDCVPCVLHLHTNKYGTPGLPEYIEKYEYQYIISSIEDEDAKEMVEDWYILDENANPPAYRLQAIVPDHPMVISPDKHERKVMSARWTSTESRLFHIMREAVDQCYGFRQERRDKWEIAPIGRQVSTMLDDSTASEKTLCIIRNIAQFSPLMVPNNNLNQRNLSLHIDLDHNENSRDLKAQKRLDAMRRRFKALKVKCKKYSINWSPFGINESTHLDYLNHVTGSVLKEMKTRLHMALERPEDMPDDLVVEVASHSRYCLNNAENFLGRENLLDKITEYLTDDSNHPLILHGDTGSGKTSLMAAAIAKVSDLFDVRDDVSPVMIARFCSLQKNLTASDFLRSVSQQIRITCSTKKSYDIMLQVEKCLDLENLGGIFRNLLSKASEDSPLFMFFDSIDDLRNGYIKAWLPLVMPANVKIVVSIQSQYKEFLPSELVQPARVLHVSSLDKTQAHDLLVGKFSTINRTLQPEQLDHIVMASLDGPDTCSSMYRLQLLFEMSSNWSSSEKLKAFDNDPATMLSKFLEKLELDHGKLLVAHVLSLLHLSRCGLSEPHLLDILSADEEVLESVLLVNPPPTKRFPHSIFSQLRRELGDHLVESAANGRNVIVIADRQMAEAINKRYIGNEIHLKEKYYSLIANYFLGEMQDRYPGRSLAPQPLHMVNTRNGFVHLNQAKLCELPRASILGSNPSYTSNSLCNLTFIAAKCAAGLLDDLLEDYYTADSHLNENEDMNEFWYFVKSHGQDLTQNPELTLDKALDWGEDSVVYAQARTLSEARVNVAPWVTYAPPKTGISRITSAGVGSHFDTMSDITSIRGGAPFQITA